LREASMKAGLAPETLSKILRRGASSTPRPDTIQQIADALGGDYIEMMRLAGHLETPEVEALRPTETWRKLGEIGEMLSDLPSDLQGELLNSLVVQTQAARTLYEAGIKYDSRPKDEREEQPHKTARKK